MVSESERKLQVGDRVKVRHGVVIEVENYRWPRIRFDGGEESAINPRAIVVLPEPHTLAEAERKTRMYVANHPDDIAIVMAEYDRMRAELDRIHHVQCLGRVYGCWENPPEQCGDRAGHEGECQP